MEKAEKEFIYMIFMPCVVLLLVLFTISLIIENNNLRSEINEMQKNIDTNTYQEVNISLDNGNVSVHFNSSREINNDFVVGISKYLQPCWVNVLQEFHPNRIWIDTSCKHDDSNASNRTSWRSLLSNE